MPKVDNVSFMCHPAYYQKHTDMAFGHGAYKPEWPNEQICTQKTVGFQTTLSNTCHSTVALTMNMIFLE